MQYTGNLSSRIKGSFIYFIFFDDFLYVGETEKHPTQRWSSHLQSAGSFRKALIKHNDGVDQLELSNGNIVTFYAFHCTEVEEKYPATQHKLATKAVEYEVHKLLMMKPSLIPVDFTLISDTLRTAPRRFENPEWSESVALEGLHLLAKHLMPR